jgi:hypothetical protein
MTVGTSWEISAQLGNFPRIAPARGCRRRPVAVFGHGTPIAGWADQESLHAITGDDEYTFGRTFRDGHR